MMCKSFKPYTKLKIVQRQHSKCFFFWKNIGSFCIQCQLRFKKWRSGQQNNGQNVIIKIEKIKRERKK